MTHANNIKQKTGRSRLLAPVAAVLLFAPLAFGTPMEVSEAPARATPSSSSAVLTNSIGGQSGVNSPQTQIQVTPDQASLFGGNGTVNGRSVVAEPGTLLLIGLGLLGITAVRRRR